MTRRPALARLALLAVLSLALPGPAGATPVLFGITWGEQLVRIDTASGATSVVGDLDSTMKAFGLGARDGRLYAYDQIADLVREIDPATGHTLASVDIGGRRMSEGALDFTSQGVGYLSESPGGTGRFWTFDVETGTSALLSPTLRPSMDGFAFEPGTDQLYAISQGGFQLHVIDLLTGTATAVGAPNVLQGPGRGDVAGLAFGPDSTLFLTAVGNLYVVDTSTGRATLVGPTSGHEVMGLTFVEVPEPTFVLLLGGVLLSLVVASRRRRR